jgi:hypothetical protein
VLHPSLLSRRARAAPPACARLPPSLLPQDAVAAAGPLLVILGFIVFPLIWSVPEALITAELATAFPENSGYVAWVSAAFGPFWGFQEGWWSWLSGVTDNSIYPVMLADNLRLFFPALSGGWQRCAENGPGAARGGLGRGPRLRGRPAAPRARLRLRVEGRSWQQQGRLCSRGARGAAGDGVASGTLLLSDGRVRAGVICYSPPHPAPRSDAARAGACAAGSRLWCACPLRSLT